MCTVKLRHKDKCVRCRFFVVSGDIPVLLGMLDIELLSILRMACDIIGEPHESGKFDLQTIETSSSPSCRANEALQIKTDRADIHDDKINMRDYFRPSANKVVEKE